MYFLQDFLKRAYAVIHTDYAENNLNKIKSLLKQNTEIMAVVKANAYGHDERAIAEVLRKNGVKYFAVSNIREAIDLRKICPDAEILLLGYTSPEYTEKLCENNLICTLISKEHAEKMSISSKGTLRCHIAVDTGMGRIGLRSENAEETADSVIKISAMKNICVEGIFTHFAVADSNEDSDVIYTQAQRDSILKANEILKRKGLDLKHVHFLNSAGGTYYSDEKSTLARFGIMLYGLYPNPELKLPVELQPVMELKAEIVHVKEIAKGSYVSYGRKYCADKTVKTATISIGYADGYPRLLSNLGEVLIHGKRAKIMGRVCMDQLMADVSEIPDVRVGDIATLFGTDGNETITADELALKYGTIGYELVCGISKRVPRVIMYGDSIKEVIEY